MAAKTKDYVPMSFKIRSDIAAQLGEHNSRTGVPKTFTVERALEEYLERQRCPDAKPGGGGAGGKASRQNLAKEVT
ncbi:MAG: type II toxin-antitoxin system VapB family antitoxin [Muribaculaceae bacterium]|nr:type II toxin-antitoxin system VapB family antitoxin [Muribaculaceae bacterium]